MEKHKKQYFSFNKKCIALPYENKYDGYSNLKDFFYGGQLNCNYKLWDNLMWDVEKCITVWNYEFKHLVENPDELETRKKFLEQKQIILSKKKSIINYIEID